MSGLRSSMVLALVLGVGCKPDAPVGPPAADGADAAEQAGTPADDAAFQASANAILDAYLEHRPHVGVELGLHEFDGRLVDVGAEALAADVKWLEQSIEQLQAIDPAGLSKVAAVEHAALLTALRNEQFTLVQLDAPRRNPMFYMQALDLTAYISRDYAPLQQRAQAIIAIAEATPAYLQHAQQNLNETLPRTFVETALLQSRGVASFVRTDVAKAMRDLDPDTKKALGTALAAMAKSVDGYTAFLEGRLKTADDSYPLGKDKFAAMLSQTQGIDVDLARLEQVLRADLQRNLAAIEAAAAQIDPKAPVAKVVAKVSKDKPAPDQVLATATEQAEQMRAFLIEKDLLTIPTDDVAKVVESPPFMRWNAAFLSSAGVFEKAALPSFYYISPPDPSWPRKVQQAYIPDRYDLLFITIHEVWPGHFLHNLHLKTSPSRILKSLWNYTSGEGWAHYTEEMMWDAGVSDDPKVRIGQLKNALLRDVRALSALGLHTGSMSVEESKQMFVEQAFQDEGNAQQQAVRGTFDPMYLAYTTGKLVILKLRDDVKSARGEAFDLKGFHDELLSYGAAPLSAVRRAMLGQTGSML